MSNFLRIALVCAVFSSVACNKFRAFDESKKPGRTSQARENTRTDYQNKSNEHTSSAEHALAKQDLQAAQQSLTESLNYDPQNTKAKFYKEVLKVSDAYKGYYKRITPMVHSWGEGHKQIYKDNIEAWPTGSLKNYLLDGQEDIKTEADMDKSVNDIKNSYAQLKKYLTDNKDVLFPKAAEVNQEGQPEPTQELSPEQQENLLSPEKLAEYKKMKNAMEGISEEPQISDLISEDPNALPEACTHVSPALNSMELTECLITEISNVRYGKISYESLMNLLTRSEEYLTQIMYQIRTEF